MPLRANTVRVWWLTVCDVMCGCFSPGYQNPRAGYRSRRSRRTGCSGRCGSQREGLTFKPSHD